MKFKDQVVLITGAGRGIGKAMALAFAHEGADIGFAEIEPESARATAEEIKAEGRRVFFKSVDVANYSQVQAWVAEVARELGRVDVLVNNAGIAKAQPFLEITPENWEGHLRVHLFGFLSDFGDMSLRDILCASWLYFV
jgi:NAD(P)-dependent dehydrogenase (short-subunit alcohol dehydrogenase family)